jgi:hypothetical protein
VKCTHGPPLVSLALGLSWPHLPKSMHHTRRVSEQGCFPQKQQACADELVAGDVTRTMPTDCDSGVESHASSSSASMLTASSLKASMICLLASSMPRIRYFSS